MDAHGDGTTILTLALDAASQLRFEELRRQHYPAALNRIPAHLTLFHKLPAEPRVAEALRQVAAGTRPFALEVTGLRSLGGGVAYVLESAAARALHGRLSAEFSADLIAQDRQPFRPHIVVQNKVKPEQAKALLAELIADFRPFGVQAVGVDWWDYLAGPWKLRERLPFPGESVEGR